MSDPFSTIDEVQQALRGENYVCGRELSTAVFLAHKLEKPLLVEGPAGVGKTELARVMAGALGADLIRLQCYEGLDEGKALYEWEYGKQLLYTQILRGKIDELLAGAEGLDESMQKIFKHDDLFFSEHFLLPRPLLRAITGERQTVLLIDEIDKADPEFEAFLLEILSDFSVTVPELGTIKAKNPPHVVLTSNNARDLSDALRRRCLHHYIDYPAKEVELDIIRLKVPGVGESLGGDLLDFIRNVRELDLKKKPAIGETLDWAKALTLLNAHRLEPELVRTTLGLLCKYKGDQEKVSSKIESTLAEIDKRDAN